MRADCSTQLAAAAMSISEMKAKISTIENKDVVDIRQGQQHAELLLKDIERRVGEAEEAMKRMQAQVLAENNTLHSMVSDSGTRHGQRLEDVRPTPNISTAFLYRFDAISGAGCAGGAAECDAAAQH